MNRLAVLAFCFLFSFSAVASEGFSPFKVRGFGSKIRFKRSLLGSVDYFNKELPKSNVDSKNWKLDSVVFSLGLTAKGSFGLLSWGGTQVLEIFWQKNPYNNRLDKKSAEKENPRTFQLSGEETKEQAEKKVLSLVSNVLSAKGTKLTPQDTEELKKKTWEFVQLVNGLKSSSSRKLKNWNVDTLRWDFGIGLDASLGGAVLVKVGGDIRLGLEWKVKKTSTPSTEVATPGYAQSMANMISSMDYLLEHRDLKKIKEEGFELGAIRLGVALNASGSVGIGKLSGGSTIYVILKPAEDERFVTMDTAAHIPLIVEEEEASEKKGIFQRLREKKVKYLRARRVKKSFKKSLRMARKVAKNIVRKNERRQRTPWRVSRFRLSYVFSLGGDIGLATVNASPSFRLDFLRVKRN